MPLFATRFTLFLVIRATAFHTWRRRAIDIRVSPIVTRRCTAHLLCGYSTYATNINNQAATATNIKTGLRNQYQIPSGQCQWWPMPGIEHTQSGWT